MRKKQAKRATKKDATTTSVEGAAGQAAAVWVDPADLVPWKNNPRDNDGEPVAVVISLIQRFGFGAPIVARLANNEIIAGHTRQKAALELKLPVVPVRFLDISEDDAHALALSDNRANEIAKWNPRKLQQELAKLQSKAEGIGWKPHELMRLLRKKTKEVVQDPIPDAPDISVTKPGDLWLLGEHRVLCGDSTERATIERLMDGETTGLLHADPPYGMGKESDGVENDNLNDSQLDDFQMAWWDACRPSLVDNASAYIWGNPLPLWRLWFGRLSPSEELSFRNEIVWSKVSGFGQRSHELRSYAASTERCIFFMLGRQYFGNVNKDDFFEGFEPVRSWLEEQCNTMGWGPSDIRRICGVQMYGHWFSQSQWTFVPERHYLSLQREAAGQAFEKSYAELKAGHLRAKGDGSHLDSVHSFNEMRSYFDNTHDNMNEVWSFPRVQGVERWGHATPKPVGVAARAIRSSAPEGGIVLEPFLGSGTTLIAAEQVDRRCFGVELSAPYCDVVVARWEKLTGKRARRA